MQQAEGRVGQPQGKGGPAVNEDASLEREADELGARAARGEVVRTGPAVGGGSSGVLQPKRGTGVIQAFNRHTAWMWDDPARQADFLAALGAMTCREAEPYCQLARLRTPWPSLVPNTAGSPPDPGRLRLALLDLALEGDAADAASKSFLSSLVTSGAFTVDVNTPLAGLSDEDAILMTLGLHPRQDTGGGADPSTPAPDANVDINQDDANESLVTPMSANGTVNARKLYVRAQPTVRGRPLGRLLSRGESVYIMGQTGNWYLVDLDGQRGYSYQRYIDVG